MGTVRFRCNALGMAIDLAAYGVAGTASAFDMALAAND
jgi:hypothetical protein